MSSVSRVPLSVTIQPRAQKSRRCIVLGVNGQDGSFLAEHLLAAGHAVTGLGRQPASRWVPDQPRFQYRQFDVGDSAALFELLGECAPHQVFHVAAVHGSAGFLYEDHWLDVHRVNIQSAHAVLEYQRRYSPESVFVYASSSKVFDPAIEGSINENSPRRSTCIYSTTKNAATDLVHYYRLRHHLHAGVVWTFNHESSRRPDGYFISRIVAILARALVERSATEEVATLGFWCDWGDAREYMAVLADIAARAPGQDFVLATGEPLWAADVVAELFGKFGLRAEQHIREKSLVEGRAACPTTADISKLRSVLGYAPQRRILEVCEHLLRDRYPEAWMIARHSR